MKFKQAFAQISLNPVPMRMSKSRWSAIQSIASERVWFAFALLLVTSSMAVFPALLIEEPAEAEIGPFWFWRAVGLTGWFVFYWAVWSFLAHRRVFAIITLVATFSLILFLRFLLYGVNRFSGSGFSSQFFLHLEPESLRVAWAQCPDLIMIGVATILVLVTVATWLARKTDLVLRQSRDLLNWRPKSRRSQTSLADLGTRMVDDWRRGQADLPAEQSLSRLLQFLPIENSEASTCETSRNF